MKEQVVRACECGSTLKFSTLSPFERARWLSTWNYIHRGRGHEPIDCETARKIRDSIRQTERNKRRSLANA